jgi:tagatose-6-phosphate ketose/aldose isomerase
MRSRLDDVSQSTTTNTGVWLQELAAAVPALAGLLAASPEEQAARGYAHTLREICQQPLTWLETSDIALAHRELLSHAMRGAPGEARAEAVVLTGSGSSMYAANCLALPLQGSLQVPVVAMSGGQLLTEGRRVLPPGRPTLVVSFARSGNSPESIAAVDLLLEEHPACHHLVITCNRFGRLVASYAGNPRVASMTLADRTCDRSLVMTSSFTNMVLAGLSLAYLDRWAAYRGVVERLASLARTLLLSHTGCLAEVARGNFNSAVFLGSGPSFGAAMESALKVVEISGGRVRTFAETYLGLRHGPLAAVHDDTLVVCFLSSDPVVRAYEQDLIQELNRKGLGFAKVLVGDGIPPPLLNPGDLAVECPGLAEAGDDAAPVLHVIAGQLIGFFRSLKEGLHPDSPSVNGAINRVVESFRIHRRSPQDRS